MSPIILNLIVLRSANFDRAMQFYSSLGLTFVKHRHGKGPEHYSSEIGDLVFEIYQQMSEQDNTKSVRIGFRVPSLDDTVTTLLEQGGTLVSEAKTSEWGRRAVINDPDGHRVELTEGP